MYLHLNIRCRFAYSDTCKESWLEQTVTEFCYLLFVAQYTFGVCFIVRNLFPFTSTVAFAIQFQYPWDCHGAYSVVVNVLALINIVNRHWAWLLQSAPKNVAQL